jgi:hypothetical protein
MSEGCMVCTFNVATIFFVPNNLLNEETVWISHRMQLVDSCGDRD